ncbi:hypothetical protein ACH3XW_36030 [Acanthocheilonema viteae]
MVHSTISTSLLTVSTVVLLVASESNVPWNSDDGLERPSSFPSEPPFELKSILPPATFAQLTAIHQNQTLTIPQKMMKIDEIINALPESILQQLPLPPVFRLLPQYVQEVIKAVRIAKNLTMQEKWLQMTIIIESLPNEQRQMLQQIMPHFPSKKLPLLSPFQKLPINIQQKLQSVHMQHGLSVQQRFQKMKAIIESLPLEMKKLGFPH